MSIKDLNSRAVVELVVEHGYERAAAIINTNMSSLHYHVRTLGLLDEVQVRRNRKPYGSQLRQAPKHAKAIVLRSEYAKMAAGFTSCWRECHVCAVWFYIKPSWVKKGRGNCCSWPCAVLKKGQGSVVKNATVIIKASRKQWRTRTFVAGPCCVCGELLIAKQQTKHALHCDGCVTESQRAVRKAHQDRRKARQRGAFKTAPVYRRKVFERDKWKCHICGDRIDKSLRAPDRGSATLDHIVPLAFGGEHTMHNVKAAHYGCNSRRGHHAEFQTVLAVAA